MMKVRYLFLSVLVAFIATLLLLDNLDNTVHATTTAPPNLAYQANIYGGTGLETIEYLSDLKFYSWGGFGVNAHVFRARLQSGDQIAYAISANDPDAFALNVVDQFSNTLQVHVTNSMYSAGAVTQPTTDTLHFVWEIQDQGLHLNLHRIATLEREPNVKTQHIVREKFAIENLGAPFTLTTFIEYWHMDDRAQAWDYDSDGLTETLLAINSYSSSGYPVFGKVYVQRPNLRTELISGGVYATINHPFHQPFATNAWQDISEAVYVSSTALNGIEAERQVAEDAKYLLNVADRLTLQYPFSSTNDWGDIKKLITSFFDHMYPKYDDFPNNQGNAYRNIVTYWGEFLSAGTSGSCNRWLTSTYLCYDGHNGYDFGIPDHEPILAAADGIVTFSDWKGLYGNTIIISHTNNYETMYNHLSSITSTLGTTVTAGTQIGVVGNTSTVEMRTHLHFTLFHNGKEVDPYGWIPGEVLIDPNTQPLTNTNTGAVYQGEASVCLWATGCPTDQWVNPNQTTEINSVDGTASLTVPANAITNITHFSIIPAFDPVASSIRVPTDYSYDIRAWDRTGNLVTNFVTPLEFTVHYDDWIFANVDEATLNLYWWDQTQPGWEQVATTLDTNNNTATTALSHLSWLSLRGTPINPAPHLSSVVPQKISTEIPVKLTITGDNFRPNADVWLGNARLRYTLINPNTIQATVPAWEPNGIYDVRVINSDYQAAELTSAVEIATPFRLFLPVIKR